MGPAGGVGDRVLYGLCALAGLLAVFVLVEVVYQVIHGASPSISHFGLGFLGHSAWAPNFGIFGAAAAIYGTVISSLMALALATWPTRSQRKKPLRTTADSLPTFPPPTMRQETRSNSAPIRPSSHGGPVSSDSRVRRTSPGAP